MFKKCTLIVFLVALIAFCSVVFYRTDIEPNLVPRIDIKRTVYVKVMVDKVFRDYPGWERLIQDLIKQSSYHFNSQFGIEIVFKGIEGIETPSVTDIRSSMIGAKFSWLILLGQHVCNIVNAKTDLDYAAEHVNSEDYDIIVYFTGKNYGLYLGCVNEIPGRYTLIIHNGREDGFQKTLHVFVHEIGHLFGAVHINCKNSVMCPGSFKSLKFDKINKKRILKYKWRIFQEQSREN